MVFVVDAFGAWLVEQIADAGRKKLTELILGGDQDRALRQAADAAIRATAAEFSPPSSERAGQAAMVINQVFSDPQPETTRAGPVMLLEGLQAGITRQLAVLDDASLTGTGQSSADILGMPGTVLADRLTGHLIREITVRGSGGGPLTPLAGQLNHELTRLYLGQRIESMLAELAARVGDAQALPGGGTTSAGRPLAEVTDRYTNAIEQVGSDKLDVRIGGIYALERIARDFPRDHQMVMEILTAFIRQHSHEQWPLPEHDTDPTPPRGTRPDVQAAVTVIGRRDTEHDMERIDLTGASLIRAILVRADLADADLTSADLTAADLAGANLAGARITSATLAGARLFAADLTRAVLDEADLTGVSLDGDKLAGASLGGAILVRASLRGAGFADAYFGYADLTNAHLTSADLADVDFADVFGGADFTGAWWPADTPVPEGWELDTGSGRLVEAHTDTGQEEGN
jgi:Pentapeptide repeats (8 copies)